jgi:hypothetical protein
VCVCVCVCVRGAQATSALREVSDLNQQVHRLQRELDG